MVARPAGFDRDHSRRKLLEECEHLLASQLLSQNRLLGGVHAVKLKNVFRRIHTNSANLFHGRPPLSEIYSDLILARSMPSGAVHTNRKDIIRPWQKAAARQRNTRLLNCSQERGFEQPLRPSELYASGDKLARCLPIIRWRYRLVELQIEESREHESIKAGREIDDRFIVQREGR